MTGRIPDGGAPDEATPDNDRPVAYTPVQSVDTGSIARIAVADSRIALASVSGGITVLTPETDNIAQFSVEERPRGLAVGPLVYVALDDCVLGYDTDGSKRWESSIDGVSALCRVSDPSGVVAATDAGEFVLLDASDGTERHRTDRTHADVSETVVLAGRDDEFLAGESWYLTGFGADGDRRGEAMLDGTITGLGLLDGVSVVSLHGDRIVGVDAADGTTRWTRDLGVEWLAPRGSDGLYAASDRGIVCITPDGEVTDAGVDAPDAAQVAITTDGSLACRIDGRTAEVLRPRAAVSDVDVEITPASLRVGEELTVTVANPGSPTIGTVRVSGEEALVRPDSRSVSLDADDQATLRFTLADAVGSQVTIRAAFEPADGEADDQSVTQTTVTVPESTSAPAVDAECLHVADGTGSVELAVETPDGSDLPAVSVAPGDTTIDPESGRSVAARTLSVPLGTDRLTVTTDDADPIDVEVSVPAAPLSAAIQGRDDGFVDVTVANDAAVSVDDEVRVTGDLLAAPVERPVSLDPGDRLTLAVPTTHSGSGEIRVDAAVISTAATVTLPSAAFPAADTTAGTGRDARPHEHQAGTPSPPDARPADTNASPRGGDTAASARSDETPDGAPQGREPARSDTRTDPTAGRDGTTTPTGTAAGPESTNDRPERGDTRSDSCSERTDARSDSRSERNDARSDARSERADDRAVHPDTEDTLSASDSESTGAAEPSLPGDSSLDPVSSGSGDPNAHTDPPPGQPADTTRDADAGAPVSRESIDLSRRLESETAHEGHAIEETLTIENPANDPRSVTIEADDEQATLDVPPDATATVSRYHAGWDTESSELPAVTARTDTAEVSAPAASIPIESAPVVVRPALSVQSTSTDIRLDVRNNLDTTCSVLEIGSKGFPTTVGFEAFDVAPGATDRREASTDGTPAERPALTFVRIDRRQRPLQTVAAVDERTTPPITVTVDAVEVVGDRDTNVVVRVRNDGGSPLDVHIEATGDAPDEYLYTGEDIDALGHGADAVHQIECTVDDDRIELPIELTATPTGDDDSRATTVVVSGDRTAETSTWQVDAEGDDAPDLPTTLSTPLDADD